MKGSKTTICFLADRHGLYDDRIYWKMAVPLKKRGYKIHYLLVADKEETGITDEGIYFETIKTKQYANNKYLNFLIRNLRGKTIHTELFLKAKKLNANIYHFHDLWINKIGGKLKKLDHNPIVFYDAREPYAQDYIAYAKTQGILSLPIRIVAFFIDKWEKQKSKKYDLVIANETIVRDEFRKVLGNDKAEVIYNFTDNYNSFDPNKKLKEKEFDFIYTGGISELRGAIKIIEATRLAKEKLPNVKVLFLGKYAPEGLYDKMLSKIKAYELEDNVVLKQYVNYSEIASYYNNSKVGFIIPADKKTFRIKMYIKIFEYMAFGLPIIGSNFGHIKEFLEKDNCGLLVNPDSVSEISDAMVSLLTNNKLYEDFSKNGREVTLKSYKWDYELERLINFYNKALKDTAENEV